VVTGRPWGMGHPELGRAERHTRRYEEKFLQVEWNANGGGGGAGRACMARSRATNGSAETLPGVGNAQNTQTGERRRPVWWARQYAARGRVETTNAGVGGGYAWHHGVLWGILP